MAICLCLGIAGTAGICVQETHASAADSSIRSAKEILFDIEEEPSDDIISEDSGDLEETADPSAELDIRDSYAYLAEGLKDTDSSADADPSVEDEDLREALAALEEKIEKEGILSATRAAKGGIWGEANELSIREEMVQFALQYVGNPYVWGGTSLTNGADCSGFVLAVHNHFGYALPRVAADQYAASRKKDISALEPGDLVFYGNGISHVAMYIGDGQIVHAANSRLGIIVSDITWMNPVGGGTFLD